MTAALAAMVQRWSRGTEGEDDLLALYNLLTFLSQRVLYEYEPCRGTAHPPFLTRLERWLSAANSDDTRQSLFRLLGEVYFVGQRELEVLHVSAFEDIVAHWLIERAGLEANRSLLPQGLEAELAATWFCPVTDSMEIARFCHLNGVSGGHDYRPDWRSLAKFGDASRVAAYLQKTDTRHIVLLEDFVGTGNQAAPAVAFAGEVAAPIADVLFCPLIIARDGVARLAADVSHLPHVEIIPALTLTEECHVRRLPPSSGDPSAQTPAFRRALLDVHDQVAAGDPTLSPFGYDDIGTLAIPFANCPNNAPPVLHHTSGSWYPLFPRSSRT